MGKGDEDVAGSFSTPSRTVTVRPYYMDETEITNSEYREFVFRVRDSILRTKLAILAEEANIGGGAPIEQKKGDMSGISKYKFKEQDSTDNAYYKYMMDNYGSLGDINSPTEGRYLNWDVDLVWNTSEFPDEYYAEAMDSLYLPIDESIDRRRKIDTKKLVYTYVSFDREGAARNEGGSKEFLKKTEVQIYPDTAIWVKDFNY